MCDTNIIESDEAFYRRLLKSSKDSSVIREYLENHGACFKEGIHLKEIRGVPMLERFECSVRFENEAAEYFFKDGKLCSKKAEFFPSRNVFYLDGTLSISSIAQGWETVSSRNSTLFYKSGFKFKERQDVNGRILNISELNLFTDSLKRPVHPYFVFLKGKWESVLPLRELFELNIRPDASFEIKIITESPLSYEKDEIIETIGLKADVFEVETPEPCRYFIEGKTLSGVRIPKLKTSEKGSGFHGTYIIRLSYEGISDAPAKVFSEENYQIIVSSADNTMNVVLQRPYRRRNCKNNSCNKSGNPAFSYYKKRC